VKSSQWLILAACAVTAMPLAVAHHSTAMFEWGTERTLSGTIEKYQWTQPHTFIWIVAPDKSGKMREWGLEGMSPSWLGRRGWDLHSLNAGEKVRLVYYPLKDGRPGGFYVRVIAPDGKTLEALPTRNQ
jgi:Family of unknown function (DUF6152)